MGRWFSAFLPVLLYGALIVFLSAQSELPHAPKIWDKAAHFGEYTILALLVTRGVRLVSGWSGVKSAATAVFLATAFAVTDEAHQFFVPGRDSDPWDVVADFLGSLFGAGTYLAWLQLRARFRRSAVAG
ncbi:VanZ family protein [Vulgatibacter sp.]|uniref:VanZ family protein n=1 Tax=Vulgatibacter sp. TaxID=1971226 RepID=UPI003567BBD4